DGEGLARAKEVAEGGGGVAVAGGLGSAPGIEAQRMRLGDAEDERIDVGGCPFAGDLLEEGLQLPDGIFLGGGGGRPPGGGEEPDRDERSADHARLPGGASSAAARAKAAGGSSAAVTVRPRTT